MLEMTGSSHYRYVGDYLYAYSGSSSSSSECKNKLERIDGIKSRLKISFKELNSLDDPLEHVKNSENRIMFYNFKEALKNYKNCLARN
jgi:hypothetical protein